MKLDLPQLIIGDFNDLAWQFEKRGNIPHPKYLLTGFKETINECELYNLGMSGYPFTWERGIGTYNWVEERRDQALVSSNSRETYGKAEVVREL